MCDIEAGDLVRTRDAEFEMLVIGQADDPYWEPDAALAFFFAWEHENLLYEEVFTAEQLVIARQERRRIPRRGELSFPCKRA